MKIWFILILSLITSELCAQAKNEKPAWEKPTPSYYHRHDPLEDQKSPRFEKMFFNSPDTSLRLEPTPEFISMDQVLGGQEFELFGGYPIQTALKIQVPGFIYPEMIKNGVGVIIGGLEAEHVIGGGAHAMMKTNGTPKVGKVYTLLRPGKSKKDGSGKKWYQYTPVGTVVAKKLEVDNKMIVRLEEGTAAKAGDLVMEYMDLNRVLEFKDSRRKRFPAKARVAVFHPENAETAGEGSLVYLDRGSDSGLSMNQVLDLYRDPIFRKLDTVSPQRMGSVIIVDTTPYSAAALILDSKFEIAIGDFATSKL